VGKNSTENKIPAAAEAPAPEATAAAAPETPTGSTTSVAPGAGAPGTVKDLRTASGIAAPQEDRFEMLDNSAGFEKGQVVTENQVKAAHAGVALADWLERKIVKATDLPVTPAK
jgi:hypothetical protein